MKLEKLIDGLKNYNLYISGNADLNIDYISYDSRDVKKNTLFVCKGVMFNKKYLDDAIKKGAICYVS